jgi:sodium/potassium-transporting ATPase subunit alpha
MGADSGSSPSGNGVHDPIDEHRLSVEDVFIKYGSDHARGMSKEAVEEYHRIHGLNSLSPPKTPSLLIQYAKHLANVFNLLLMLSGVLSFVLYASDSSDNSNLYLGFILPAIGFMNAFLTFYQEYKVAALLESFLKLIPSNSQVIRDGTTMTISSKEIVPGDLVNLKDGDKIPADMRVVKCTEMKVDNSSLTGESEPLERVSDPSTVSNFMEASNLLFNGTTLVRGSGQAVVLRIGDSTVLGQIANLTMQEKKRDAQMAREINLFVKKLGVVAILSALILVIAGFIRGYFITVNIAIFIGVFISWIPEGLPLAVTAMLSITAKRMARLNVLVKDLQAVETLGAITMLATDKTGTLTQNRMTVVGIWMQGECYNQSDKTYQIEHNGVPISTSTIPNLETLIDACALCTKCYIDESEREKDISDRNIVGEPTEIGIYRYAMIHCDVVQHAQRYPKVCEIPFSSSTKWHLSIHEQPHANGSYVAYLKGAPERVMLKCSQIITKGATETPLESQDTQNNCTVTITDDHRAGFQAAYEHFAKQGQRVLAFAKYPLPEDKFPKGFVFKKQGDSSDGQDARPNFPIEDFTFVALVSLMDPPKHGVRKAVAALRTAGIQVVMVTGDHPLTAEAIGRKIGMLEGDTILEASLRLQKPVSQVQDDEYDVIIVHGDNLDNMSDMDWDRVLSKRYIIFARTSPKHKLMIVSRAQAKGHIVGVSGDGVNDSPALKKADLGISMNITGSDVSKEAATMILMDDNFPTIVCGIAQGRLLFANLKKTIRYTLSHIFPEVASFIGYVLFNIPLPLTSLLILVFDVIAEAVASVTYAYEPPEDDLMFLPPRKVLCTEDKSYATYQLETHQSSDTLNSVTSPTSPVDMPMRSGSIISATSQNNGNSVSVIDQSSESWISKKWFSLKLLLKRNFRPNETGEVLIDNELLLWCYPQAGLFIAIGAYGAYLMQFYLSNVPLTLLWNTGQTYFIKGAPSIILTDGTVAGDTKQMDILAAAQSAYLVGLMIGQMFTLFLVKKRYGYPWGRSLLTNKMTFLSLFISAAVICSVVYIPAFNTFFPSGPVGILAWLMPVGSGILYYSYECIRRHLIMKGYFGGLPKCNVNLLELVRTTTTIKMPPSVNFAPPGIINQSLNRV